MIHMLYYQKPEASWTTRSRSARPYPRGKSPRSERPSGQETSGLPFV